MKKILLVEDDEDLSYITMMNLKKAKYQVEQAYSCSQAVSKLSEMKFDIILLDMMLPDNFGEWLCGKIRNDDNNQNRKVPIIFISCLEDKEKIISALKGGGDDYMTKPVDYNELIARIEVVLRRISDSDKDIHPVEKIKRYKQFDIDLERRRVLDKNGDKIDLSPTEYSLLLKLSSHPGELLLYNELYSSIWESESLGDVRTVMVHISNLRKKIDINKSGVIENVRGAGYIFNDEL